MHSNTKENVVTEGIGTSNTSTQTSSLDINVAPKAADTSTMNNNSERGLYELISTNLLEVAELKKRINNLEKQQNKTKSFYKSVTNLSKISTIIIYIMMIIPILQLIGCAAVVYHLGIQDDLPGLLKWVLSGVSILSLGEMIFIPIKFHFMDNKITSLEEKNNEENNGK